MSEKKKIVELTEKPWDRRWVSLQALAQAADINIEVQTVATLPATFALDLKKTMDSDAQAIVIDASLAGSATLNLSRTTQESVLLGATDLLLKENQDWWPRPCLVEALVHSLAPFSKHLDLKSYALVAGNDGFAYLAVAALVRLGFTTINITDFAKDENPMTVQMTKKYFGVHFNYVPFHSITTLPGVHSIVVNSTPLTLENELLDELYFFNFLKAGGVVVDLSLIPSQTPLTQEAEAWGARHLSGDAIMARRDILIVEKLFGTKISHEDYKIALRKETDAVPFDALPFLKRFRERGT